MPSKKPFEISGELDARQWTATFSPGDVTGLSAVGVPPRWMVVIDGIEAEFFGPSDVPGEDTPETRERLELFIREQIAQHETASTPDPESRLQRENGDSSRSLP
jgi:hypothetical protein